MKEIKGVVIFESVDEAKKHGRAFSELCKCLECLIFWWLEDALYCPKCGSSHTYEIVSELFERAPKGYSGG